MRGVSKSHLQHWSAAALATLAACAVAGGARAEPARQPATSTAPADAEICWKGRIEIAPQSLDFAVVFRRAAGAEGLAGTIDIPAQRSMEVPLADVTLSDTEIGFTIGPPASAVFKATLSSEGRTAKGQMTQHGMTFPITMERSARDPNVVRAREILKLLIGGQYKEFVAAGDQAVQAAFSPAQAEQVWKGLTFQLGAYQVEQGANPTPAGEYNAVSFVLGFERGTSTLRLVLDHDGKLAGFWCDAVNPKATYQPPPYVDENSFREEQVTVSAGRFPLPGTLTIPKAGGPAPAVVLVHGSGPNDQDETIGPNKPFRDLAEGLASRGVAVLRYDKRTRVHPNATAADKWTLDDEVIDDALAAAQLLRQQSGIDPNRVYVLGHSLGGTLAPYIAQRDPKLAGIVIMAGAARSILDLTEEQITYIAGLSGDLSDEDQKELDKLKEQLAAIRAGRTQEVKEPILGVPAVYWEQLHKLDPLGTAVKLQMPILILHGRRDYQVAEKDFELWTQNLGQRKNVTLKQFEDLNHLFITGQGRSTPAEYEQTGHVSQEVIETIVGWMNGITKDSHPQARSGAEK